MTPDEAKTMHVTKHISRAELAGDPTGVLRAVRRGETVMVEDQGRPEAAIIDPVDFQIILAVIGYYGSRPAIDPAVGLPDSKLADLSSSSRFDVAIAYYLGKAISLGRTAEILKTSWLGLRERFARLGIPLHTAPSDLEGARQDLLVAESTLA
jgi:predicted HTH domain antitoxin